jgi:Ger(x)C family germination protein
VKKSVILVIAVVIFLSLFYHKGLLIDKIDITLLEPAIVMGIDKSDKKGQVRTTLLLKKIEESKNQDDEEDPSGEYEIESMDAETLSVSIEKIQEKHPKILSLDSIAIFLIGEDALKEDLYKYIDYLSKYGDLRMISEIYFVKGDTAEAVIDDLGKESSTDIFKVLNTNSGISAVNSEMEFIDFLQLLCNNNSAFATPTVELKNESSESDIKNSISLGGYAIITKGKFSAYIESYLVRSYNMLKNYPAVSVIDVPMDDTVVALNIENAKTQYKYKFDGDMLTDIYIYVKFFSNIKESENTDKMDSDSVISDLEAKQSHIIEDELWKIISISVENESDFLGIGEKLRMKHPIKWKNIKDNWPEDLLKSKIHVEVDSVIQHTYDIIKIR